MFSSPCETQRRRRPGADHLFFRLFGLELDSCCELNQAWVVRICRGGDSAEGGDGLESSNGIGSVAGSCRGAGVELKGCVGRTELRGVEDVEGLGTKLQLHSLGDVEVLEEREVDALQTGGKELVAALVADCSDLLKDEVVNVEPTVDAGVGDSA